jgi:hypothetical protein
MDSAHNERLDWREVSQYWVNTEGVVLLMFCHCEDCVRVAREHTGAADSIN